MKKSELSNCVTLAFAKSVDPLKPIAIDKETVSKIAQLPTMIRSLIECYGDRLGTPQLLAGTVYFEINNDEELFDVASTIINDLVLTSQQLNENAKRQPPLPLAQAVTNTQCIDLMRVGAQAAQKAQLVAAVHHGGNAIELARVDPSVFTEPEPVENNSKYFRARVAGACVPIEDANVILLQNREMLELPLADYPFDANELWLRIVRGDAMFVGSAVRVRRDVYRALPGGILPSQLPLHAEEVMPA